ncbi:beta-fructofuranosidase [Oceanobacillus limi]|uniref:Sucrose-6-phosphate hydrolase n=1 Tax=Oceanobacillus limi TaxID=930131 RepID=A0A1I0A735_9BACI|nr:sucrose-6-phosphate hydrolase [Oceanobacillus limi]SES89926.1 beta-fructofuranosidase [Oceanobacillus limi]
MASHAANLMQKAYERMIQSKKTVFEDPNRLHYHLMPPVGLLNDPNGLIFFEGKYHVFFQWNPFKTEHGAKFWGHYVSEDFIHWELAPIALAPDAWFDKDGCYSGSAIVNDGKLYLFYTGNVKGVNGNRESYQCLAVSEDGITFEKKGPVIEVEEGYTAHFRDPKVFEQGDAWYMVIGAQTNDEKGCVVLYSSNNLLDWSFEGKIAGNGMNGLDDFGFMWECPDLFSLANKDVLVVSPQGLESEGILYNNIYQSGYFVGNMDFQTKRFNHGAFTEIDRGFDFYAPQTFEVNGRRILIGWMGNATEDNIPQPTEKYDWVHALTLPRELELKDNKLYQQPIRELENLRENEVHYNQVELNHNSAVELEDVRGSVFELEVSISELSDGLLTIEIGDAGRFVYDAKHALFSFERIGLHGKKEIRTCAIADLETIRLFKDTSSMECFLNHGEEVFSSRVFAPEEQQVRFHAEGTAIVHVKKWNLKQFC